MALVGTQPSDFTISLGGLGDTSGRSAAEIDNESTGYKEAKISIEITSDASSAPDAGGTYDVYLLQNDDDTSDPIRDDNWAGTDASFTRENAKLLGTIRTTATTNKEFRKTFDSREAVEALGPRWGIAIVNNSGAAIHATGANSFARYRYVIPDKAG
jgi:hypothetical protein